MYQNQNVSSEIIQIHCGLVLKVHSNLEIIIFYSFQNILIWAFFTYKIVSATPMTDEEDSNLSREEKSKQITPKAVSK